MIYQLFLLFFTTRMDFDTQENITALWKQIFQYPLICITTNKLNSMNNPIKCLLQIWNTIDILEIKKRKTQISYEIFETRKGVNYNNKTKNIYVGLHNYTKIDKD